MNVNLSRSTSEALEAAARAEGISADQLADRAVRAYLRVRRFRTLRERLLEKSPSMSDQDVFDRVS